MIYRCKKPKDIFNFLILNHELRNDFFQINQSWAFRKVCFDVKHLPIIQIVFVVYVHINSKRKIPWELYAQRFPRVHKLSCKDIISVPCWKLTHLYCRDFQLSSFDNLETLKVLHCYSMPSKINGTCPKLEKVKILQYTQENITILPKELKKLVLAGCDEKHMHFPSTNILEIRESLIVGDWEINTQVLVLCECEIDNYPKFWAELPRIMKSIRIEMWPHLTVVNMENMPHVQNLHINCKRSPLVNLRPTGPMKVLDIKVYSIKHCTRNDYIEEVLIYGIDAYTIIPHKCDLLTLRIKDQKEYDQLLPYLPVSLRRLQILEFNGGITNYHHIQSTDKFEVIVYHLQEDWYF
jgi:hypothetical protein